MPFSLSDVSCRIPGVVEAAIRKWEQTVAKMDIEERG